jgi:hypothetical protein
MEPRKRPDQQFEFDQELDKARGSRVGGPKDWRHGNGMSFAPIETPASKSSHVGSHIGILRGLRQLPTNILNSPVVRQTTQRLGIGGWRETGPVGRRLGNGVDFTRKEPPSPDSSHARSHRGAWKEPKEREEG